MKNILTSKVIVPPDCGRNIQLSTDQIALIEGVIEMVEEEVSECHTCEIEKLSGEGTCYGYVENTSSKLRELIGKLREQLVIIKEN